MAKLGALTAIFILFISAYFAIPSEYNIGVTILESFDDALCDENSQENVACEQMWMSILALHLIGAIVFFGDLAYIGIQIKEGNFL